MGIEMRAGTLAGALRQFRGVIEPRNTIPILSCFEIRDGRFFATDLDTEIELAVPMALRADEGGAEMPAIEHRCLAALARLIDVDAMVRLDHEVTETKGKDGPVSESQVTLNFGDASYGLPCVADRLPRLEMPADAVETAAGNIGLVAGLNRVAAFVGREETRYYLNGVCVSRDQASGQMVLVATDGHRMAVLPIGDITLPAGEQPIIPIKAIAEIVAAKAEPSTVRFSRLRCRMEWPGRVLTTKLIDGTFPDWNRVRPKPEEATTIIEIDRVAMLKAVRRLTATFGHFATQCRFTFLPDRIAASATVNGRTMRERIAGRIVSGSEITILFNGFYMADAMAAFAGETVQMAASVASSPVTFTAEGDTLSLVLMPQRP